MTELDRAKQLFRPIVAAIPPEKRAGLLAMLAAPANDNKAATFSADHDSGDREAQMIANTIERLFAEELSRYPDRESEIDSVAREFGLTPSERAELERRM